MSILNNMIEKAEFRAEYKEVDAYVNQDLCDCSKNAYYFRGRECDVMLCNPEDAIEGFPEYSINFKTPKQASNFMLSHLCDEPYNIKMSIEGNSLMLRPTSSEYEVHFEVNNEQVAQQLVKQFRRQYAKSNGFSIPPIKPAQKTDEVKGEIEKLGIEF